jgi:hypothetical protein
MRNYNFFVKAILMLLDSPAIVRTSTIRIPVLFDYALIGKGFGKALFADVVFQTPLRRARSMKHILENNRMKLWMDLWIWNLCRNDNINLLNGGNLVLLFQED